MHTKQYQVDVLNNITQLDPMEQNLYRSDQASISAISLYFIKYSII